MFLFVANEKAIDIFPTFVIQTNTQNTTLPDRVTASASAGLFCFSQLSVVIYVPGMFWIQSMQV